MAQFVSTRVLLLQDVLHVDRVFLVLAEAHLPRQGSAMPKADMND